MISHIPDEDPYILHQDEHGFDNKWDASMPADSVLERMERLYKCLTVPEREKSQRAPELDVPAGLMAQIASRNYEW